MTKSSAMQKESFVSARSPASEDFPASLRRGLRKNAKQIPSRFFYDAKGSALFEDITRQPEYYPTKTELEILKTNVIQLSDVLEGGTVLVEFGSGSSRKTEILLDQLKEISTYVPIDISKTALDEAARRLNASYPEILVAPVLADISKSVVLPEAIMCQPRLGFFPGSTIGNFKSSAAISLLQSMAATLGRNSRLVIGVDLKKDVETLHRAYNDAAGVTADLNRNLLRRANRELDANFDLSAFRHEARYDRAAGRIDMFLVSRKRQTVDIDGETFTFQENERVHTEYSHKYTVGEFQTMAAEAGWQSERVWLDGQKLFSVHILKAR